MGSHIESGVRDVSLRTLILTQSNNQAMEPHANTPEVDINTFYKTISAKGKEVM